MLFITNTLRETMKNILLLISLLLFTGCYKLPVELQHMTKHTQVGVVSAGLDELRIQTSHARAKYAQIDISDMKLDRIFEDKLIKKLAITNMKPRRVSIYGDKTIKYSQTMAEFKYEFKSFWRGLYYYTKQERWTKKGKNGAHPIYALTKHENSVAIIKKNRLNYLISVREPYISNEGMQSQIRIGYPLIGDPYVLFEPMVPMQKLKNGKLAFVTRLDKKGYRQIETFNTNPWKNNGKLELTPRIKQEIKTIILRLMDKVVNDVYKNMVELQRGVKIDK